MDKLLNDLLIRIEILEHDVSDLQRQIDENSVMFLADMDLFADNTMTAEQFLDEWDADQEPEQ